MNIKVLLKWFLEKIKKIIRQLTPKFKEDDSFFDKCATVFLSIMGFLFLFPTFILAIFSVTFLLLFFYNFFYLCIFEACPKTSERNQENRYTYEQVFKQCYEEKKLDGTITQDSNLEFVSKAIKDCIEDKDTNLTNLIIPLIYAETMDLL